MHQEPQMNNDSPLMQVALPVRSEWLRLSGLLGLLLVDQQASPVLVVY